MNYIKKLFKCNSLTSDNSIALRRYCEAEYGTNANYVYNLVKSGKSLEDVRRLL
jgi:hypothetical protein